MSKITILAEDFPRVTGHFTSRNFTLPGDESHYPCETVCEFINTATPKMALLLNKIPDFTAELQIKPEKKMSIADDNDIFFNGQVC